MNWIDKALGIHPDALIMRARRGQVLAANIANADTPGYKARDLSFEQVLDAAQKTAGGSDANTLRTTHAAHIGAGGNGGGELKYRVPTRQSGNGNTVEAEVEQAAFADNALRYQASLQFLQGGFAGLTKALKGE